ncbi:MAG: hypothetical protein WCS21_10890 [Lachnospiraceae bacterium]
MLNDSELRYYCEDMNRALNDNLIRVRNSGREVTGDDLIAVMAVLSSQIMIASAEKGKTLTADDLAVFLLKQKEYMQRYLHIKDDMFSKQ